ncbi:MAG: sensor domain-containing diguanylate cyclase [Thermoleophilia bacterium]
MSDHAPHLRRLEQTLDLRRAHGAPRRQLRPLICEVCGDPLTTGGPICPTCRARMLAKVTGRPGDPAPAPTSKRANNGLLNSLPGVLYRASPDQRRRLSYVTDAITELTGHKADVFRTGYLTLADLIHPDDREMVREALQGEHLTRGFELEYRITLACGDERWVNDRGRRSGRTSPFWDEGLLVDVTERRRSYEQLLHEARTDALTGTANRRHLQERLSEECARSERTLTPLSVLALDADHFKRVNDTHGHDAGDRVLVDLARRFTDTVRKYDLVARVGGEEFIVVLLGATDDESTMLAERIRHAVEATPCGDLPVTISVGCTTWAPGDTADSLIKRADIALYDAKRAGRNRVVVEPAPLTADR